MRIPLPETIKRPLRKVYYRWRGRLSAAGLYKPGHFYSPVPSRRDVEDYFCRQPHLPPLSLPGIDLRPEAQRELFLAFAPYDSELPFPQNRQPGWRYYYENDFFSYGDAIILYCFLRHFCPRHIIEVGSGFSSALMLDTAEHFLTPPPLFTFIEPYPQRLLQLIRPTDRQHTNIINKRLQDVPLEVFLQLQSGDLLFIDSSHVLKCGSDVQYLLFDVLPNLAAGVFVHFHDVFYPFEYPAHWLREGRFWNEDYFLRAFLYGNSLWEIVFFNTYFGLAFPGLIAKHMPLCQRNIGGSLYLRRRLPTSTP